MSAIPSHNLSFQPCLILPAVICLSHSTHPLVIVTVLTTHPTHALAQDRAVRKHARIHLNTHILESSSTRIVDRKCNTKTERDNYQKLALTERLQGSQVKTETTHMAEHAAEMKNVVDMQISTYIQNLASRVATHERNRNRTELEHSGCRWLDLVMVSSIGSARASTQQQHR